MNNKKKNKNSERWMVHPPCRPCNLFDLSVSAPKCGDDADAAVSMWMWMSMSKKSVYLASRLLEIIFSVLFGFRFVPFRPFLVQVQ